MSLIAVWLGQFSRIWIPFMGQAFNSFRTKLLLNKDRNYYQIEYLNRTEKEKGWKLNREMWWHFCSVANKVTKTIIPNNTGERKNRKYCSCQCNCGLCLTNDVSRKWAMDFTWWYSLRLRFIFLFWFFGGPSRTKGILIIEKWTHIRTTSKAWSYHFFSCLCCLPCW